MTTPTLIAQKLAVDTTPEMTEREKFKIYRLRYRIKYPERTRESKKNYRLKNKQKIHEYYLKFKKLHPEVIKDRDKIYRKNYRPKLRIYFRNYNKTLKGRYVSHVVNGRKIKQVSKLSFEQYSSLIQQPCFYCGRQPKKNDWNGVDRKNNAVGYLIDNCVPCCRYCNLVKRDKKYDDWIVWLNRKRKKDSDLRVRLKEMEKI